MFSKSRFCFQTLFYVHPYLKEKVTMMVDLKKLTFTVWVDKNPTSHRYVSYIFWDLPAPAPHIGAT